MKGVLSHTWEDTLSWSVLVVSFLYMNCIWLHACLALKRKEKSNHALKPITCCTFDIIFYLSKNYLTRSPSWDEHISFSRVPWPTNRHQVNTLFQFQYSGTNWPLRGFLNGSGLKSILLDLLMKVTFTHTSPAGVLMDKNNNRQSKTQKDIPSSVWHAMFISLVFHTRISWIMKTCSALLVWHSIFESFVQSVFTKEVMSAD